MNAFGQARNPSQFAALSFVLLGLLLGGCANALSSDGDKPGNGANQPPVILGDTVAVSIQNPETGHSVNFAISSSDPENNTLTYLWDDGNPSAGDFVGSGASVFWSTAVPGAYVITATVRDSEGGTDTAQTSVTVIPTVDTTPNDPPAFTNAGISKDVSAPVSGQKVVFSAAAVDPNGDALTYVWSDSTGQEHFADPSVGGDGTAKVWWTAPSAGSYTINLIVNDGKNGSRVISTTVAVSTGVDVGTFPSAFSFVGAEHCSNCHPDIFAEEQQTAHAHREDNMQAAGLGRLESCRGCHNVGWQNGGYIDYELTRQFANVQCESCHGTGVGHPANGKLPLHFEAETCGKCHTGSHHPTMDEWKTSLHATFDITAETGGDNTIEASCIKCHNGDYFVKIQINGEDPPAEDLAKGSGTHIVCATCHDPHDAKYPSQLRVDPAADVVIPFDDTPVKGGQANTCLMCHNGRRTRKNMEDTIAKGGRGFHDNSQGPMIFGLGGYEFPGVVYDKEHPHNTWNQNKCVTCHMWTKEYESEESIAVTGHSFKPRYEACLGCHTFTNAEDMQVFVEGFQAETQQMLTEFETIWPAAWKDASDPENVVLNNKPSVADPPSTDGPPLGDADGDQYRAAWWDYYYVKADSSKGVHNPDYSRGLLQSAIDKVKELNTH